MLPHRVHDEAVDALDGAAVTELPWYDRGPLGSPWVRQSIQRYGLPVWFLANAIPALILQMQDTSLLYFDARLYLMATRTWLDGGDPWTVQLAGNFFAAPPPSLLPLAPLAMLPLDMGVAIIATLVIGASVLTVRMLRLPWWWLLFPPLIQTCFSANVHGLVLPLILLGGGALAVFLKAYAVVPMAILGRWRALLVATVGLIATIPILPWGTYIAEFGTIQARLEQQTDIALPTLVLVVAAPVAITAMAVLGRERAAWLAVPALWPSQQYYYASLVIGARSAVAAAIAAFPIEGAGLWALFALAVLEWHRGARPNLPHWSRTRPRTIGAVTSRTGSLDSDP